jgi:hypothetical protein
LSETHLNKARAGNLMRKLGFDLFSIFKSDGQSGGLLIMWRKETKQSRKVLQKLILM